METNREPRSSNRDRQKALSRGSTELQVKYLSINLLNNNVILSYRSVIIVAEVQVHAAKKLVVACVAKKK